MWFIGQDIHSCLPCHGLTAFIRFLTNDRETNLFQFGAPFKHWIMELRGGYTQSLSYLKNSPTIFHRYCKDPDGQKLILSHISSAIVVFLTLNPTELASTEYTQAVVTEWMSCWQHRHLKLLNIYRAFSIIDSKWSKEQPPSGMQLPKFAFWKIFWPQCDPDPGHHLVSNKLMHHPQAAR